MFSLFVSLWHHCKILDSSIELCSFLFSFILVQTSTLDFSPSLDWKSNFILAKHGENLTLQCFYTVKSTRISWFKQTPRGKPNLICMYYISASNFIFTNDFKNNPRFQLHPINKGANLTITDLKFSDTATYFCVNQYLHIFEFTEGYNVIVEGSGLTINHSTTQSGGSVMLNCTVHTEWTCNGNHTVYWFRNSEQSQPGLVHSDTGRYEQCDRKTNKCFYSASIKNRNVPQTGIYYCAVAACGHIVFGNGTKMVVEGE